MATRMIKRLIVFTMIVYFFVPTNTVAQEVDNNELGHDQLRLLELSLDISHAQFRELLHEETLVECQMAIVGNLLLYTEKFAQSDAERLLNDIRNGKNLDTNYSSIALHYADTGIARFLSDKHIESIHHLEKAFALVPQYSPLYEDLLGLLGNLYIETENEEKIESFLLTMQDCINYLIKENRQDIDSQLEIALFHSGMGNMKKARRVFVDILQRPMDDSTRRKVYFNYLSYNWSMGNIDAVADYSILIADIFKQQNKMDDYVAFMQQAANGYILASKYDKSIECHEQLLRHHITIDKAAELESWRGMARGYAAKEDHKNEIKYLQQIVEYYEGKASQNKQDSIFYATALEGIGVAHILLSMYEQAVPFLEQAVTIYATHDLVEEYQSSANFLNMTYSMLGVDKHIDLDAIELEANEKLRKLYETTLAREYQYLTYTEENLSKLALAHTFEQMATSYYGLQNYDSAVCYYAKYIETLRVAVSEKFPLQTVDQRMQEWNDEAFRLSGIADMFVAALSQQNNTLLYELSAILYDAELLSKGIILSSSIEFENLMTELQDTNLTQTYQAIKDNAEKLDSLRHSEMTTAVMARITQLVQESEQLLLHLNQGCEECMDYTQYLSYTWRDVQASLSPLDIAIEFIETDSDLESVILMVVLVKNLETPIAIPLCTSAEATMWADIHTTGNIEPPNDLWNFFSSMLQPTSRIFFAADGPLHRVAIEYFPCNGKPLAEQYEVYRLSSTKDICRMHSQVSYDNIALFGDVEYNNGTTQNKRQLRHAAKNRSGNGVGGYRYLPSTAKEMQTINSIMSKCNVEKYTKQKACKSAFVNLNNTDVNILHIATHGSYKETTSNIDEDAMDRSLLAFSGANFSDTSLVTAKDVSKMNLRQCDLAVLSACESGLGNLGDDGVFGLQRGFKNAGVRTLLMSLNNVDDNATAELMISFYRNLANGQSKRLALINAQKELREKGYTDFGEWASFILLDAYDGTMDK